MVSHQQPSNDGIQRTYDLKNSRQKATATESQKDLGPTNDDESKPER